MNAYLCVEHAVADPGFPVGGGGVDLRRGCFSAKMYAKTAHECKMLQCTCIGLNNEVFNIDDTSIESYCKRI